MFNKFKRFHLTQGIVIMAIAIFAGGLYANTVKSHFSGNDIAVIRGNETVRNFSNISRVFSEEFAKGYAVRYRFYRPLQFVGYMIEYGLWKLDAQGYHIVNIGLHVVVAIGLFWLIKLLFGNMVFAAISAFLFSIHPVHAQTVMMVSNQGGLLAAGLLLASHIGYIKATLDEDKADYMLCSLCYIAALLSYEACAVFPLLLFGYHFFLKRRLHVKEFMVIACFTLAYLSLRLWVFPRDFSGPYQGITLFFASTTDFIRYLLVPLGLYREYQPAGPQGWLNIEVLLGIAFYALAFTYIIKRKRHSMATTYFGFWLCMGMVPFFMSFLFSPFNTGGWLYLASMGFFVILARCLTYLFYDKKQPVVAVILIAVITVFYSYCSFRQIQYLKNPQKFYQTQIPS